MIGKIRKGANFAGLGRYLYGPGKREEHTDPRAVAGEHVLLDEPRDWRGWVADMTVYAGLRPDVARPVWHCALRAAPEDPVLDDARWATIAAQHIEAMGLGGYPWVAVRHGDDHVHLVACRVDPAGRVWRDSHDYARSMRSCRQLERDHGLAVLDGARRTARYASTTAGERARARRRGVDAERVRLRDAMHAARAAAAGAGVAGWERALESRGVLYRAARTHDGTVIGYRVSLPGWTDPDGEQVWLKASQVDRALSWVRIRTQFDNPPGADARPVPDRAGRTRPRRDDRRRDRPTTTTPAQLAAQGFPSAPKAPVVREGTAQELFDALLVRLRHWRWYDQQHQREQQRRRRGR